MALFSQATGVILLALGFGFVIFWHELGHFMAAKFVGIKVDQFAVGFGQAIVAWRKGLGFRVGTTKPEYDRRINDWVQANRRSTLQLQEKTGITSEDEIAATKALGLGETEYRLNWIPLGGYVKMLGQEDLDPNAQSDDPRSYNRKPVSSRMLVVSAGVIMNIILAMIGFAVVFGFGFDAPPAVVGSALQGSPAQKAGLEAGDRIAYLDGGYQHDFTMLAPNVALAGDEANLDLVVQKPDGRYVNLHATPQRPPGDGKGFLALGVEQPVDLVGLPDVPAVREALNHPNQIRSDALALRPGEKLVAINGQRIDVPPSTDQILDEKDNREKYFTMKRQNLRTLETAVQQSHGQPVKFVAVDAAGKERAFEVSPLFGTSFDGTSIRIAGMALRCSVMSVMPKSPAIDKILPGDVIEEVTIVNNASPTVLVPTIEKLKATLTTAGENGDKVNVKVVRDGKVVEIDGLQTVSITKTRYGLNIGLDQDVASTVVGMVTPNSPADKAGIPSGATITQINGKPVTNWFEIKEALGALAAGESATINVQGIDKPLTLPGLTSEELANINGIRYGVPLQFQPMSFPRQTSNPVTAIKWGVGATRDLVVQTYISLRRLVDGSVPASGMMGPVGILTAGTGFAEKGNVWLLWFLSMISANLAVVNFLPIPIVDGGLFVFLILEKIKGKPLSARTHTVAQIVGLALLGFVFVFATWQDISRMFWG